jgi:hypothetical protein
MIEHARRPPIEAVTQKSVYSITFFGSGLAETADLTGGACSTRFAADELSFTGPIFLLGALRALGVQIVAALLRDLQKIGLIFRRSG